MCFNAFTYHIVIMAGRTGNVTIDTLPVRPYTLIIPETSPAVAGVIRHRYWRSWRFPL